MEIVGKLKLPILTTAERDAITTWEDGNVIYNSTVGSEQVYGSSIWQNVASESIITSTSAPTVNDDSNAGHFIGQRWIRTFVNPANNVAYVCLDATVGAAFWYPIASSGITVNNNGDIVFNAPVIFENGVAFNSVFLTSILTANQNDFVIANMKNYTTIIFRSTVNINITGIDSTGITDWNAHIFVNGNANGKTINFKSESASSLAANRFSGVAGVVLDQGEFWWFLRNVSISRWAAQAKL